MYIGIDIGGTKSAVIFWKDDKKVGRVEIVTGEYKKALDVIKKFVEIIDEKVEREEIKGIGISCGGPLDSIRGIIQSPPNLPGWDNIHIVDILEDEYKCPVYIENDANACALAEWIYGAGKGSKNMVFLTFGTGMGAGLILNGKLYRGTNNNAGEIGHIRVTENGPEGYGKNGSFEGYCSGGGIVKLAKIMSEVDGIELPKEITTKEIFQRAEKGESFYLKVIKKSAEKLGVGLAILIDILNPERIVIGSIYARAKIFFDKEIKDVLQREALSESLSICEIVPAELGEEVGDFATLSVIKANKNM